MIKKHAEKFLLAFIIAGLIVAAWSLKNHYATTASSGCNVNRTFNCDVVNRGIYSEIGGFPVAGIGVVGYAVLGLIAAFWKKEKDPLMLKALLAFAAGGVVFSLYLSYIEAYVLYTWCLLCLASLSCIVGVTLSAMMVRQQK